MSLNVPRQQMMQDSTDSYPYTKRQISSWLTIFSIFFLWSAIHPKDYMTWFLEVFPAMAGLILIVTTYRSFPLTPLLYGLILIHMIVLMVGGHYTYAEVPLFDWIKTVFHQDRNNFDKLGHFMQGFEPAILAREILIRKKILCRKGIWLNYIVVSITLAFSAFYELVEWGVALLEGEDATAFLGTQGYVWDTQSDMLWCLVGSLCALLCLRRIHDRMLKRFVF